MNAATRRFVIVLTLSAGVLGSFGCADDGDDTAQGSPQGQSDSEIQLREIQPFKTDPTRVAEVVFERVNDYLKMNPSDADSAGFGETGREDVERWRLEGTQHVELNGTWQWGFDGVSEEPFVCLMEGEVTISAIHEGEDITTTKEAGDKDILVHEFMYALIAGSPLDAEDGEVMQGFAGLGVACDGSGGGTYYGEEAVARYLKWVEGRPSVDFDIYLDYVGLTAEEATEIVQSIE